MTQVIAHRSHRASRPNARPSLGQLIGLWRQRQALKSLDDAALKDIGITREHANAEARRSFWDAPSNWYC